MASQYPFYIEEIGKGNPTPFFIEAIGRGKTERIKNHGTSVSEMKANEEEECTGHFIKQEMECKTCILKPIIGNACIYISMPDIIFMHFFWGLKELMPED